MPLDRIDKVELIRLIRVCKTPDELLENFRGYLKVAIKHALTLELNERSENAFHLCVRENILLLPVLFSYGAKPHASRASKTPYELLLNQPSLSQHNDINIAYHFFLAAIEFLKRYPANIEFETEIDGCHKENIFDLLAQSTLDGENKFHLLIELHSLISRRNYEEYENPVSSFIAFFRTQTNKGSQAINLDQYFKFRMCVWLGQDKHLYNWGSFLDGVHATRFFSLYVQNFKNANFHYVIDCKFPRFNCSKSAVDKILFAMQCGHEDVFSWNNKTEFFYTNFCHYYPGAAPLILNQLAGKVQSPTDLLCLYETMGPSCRLSEIIPSLNLMESRQLAFLIIMFINAKQTSRSSDIFRKVPTDIFATIFNYFNTDKPNGSVMPFVYFVANNYLVIREKVRKKEQVMILEDSSQGKPKFRIYESMRLFPPVYKHEKTKPKVGACQLYRGHK